MKRTKYLPPKYWIYLTLVILLAISSFVNIFVFDGLTGEKEFMDYTEADWRLVWYFISIELLIFILAFIFAFKCGRILNDTNNFMKEYYSQKKYIGIELDDYSFVWHDFTGFQRALITENEKYFTLTIEELNMDSENWDKVTALSIFDSLAELKKSLFYDYDFYCDENSYLDEYEDIEYKEEC